MNSMATVSSPDDMASQIERWLMSQGWTSEWVSGFHNMSSYCFIMHKPDFKCKIVVESFNGEGDRGMANYTPKGTDIRAYGVCITLLNRYNEPMETYKKNTSICGSVIKLHDKLYKTTKHNDTRLCGAGIAYKDCECDLYINYSEEPNLSCVISAKMTIDEDTFYQHIAFGDIIKSGNYDGGSYLSASRSKFSLFPQLWTSEIITGTSYPLFAMAEYPATFVYAAYDGAENRDNTHRSAFLSSGDELIRTEHISDGDKGTKVYNDVTRNGTGRKLGTSIVDRDYFGRSLYLPTYEFLQSHNASDYNRVLNYAEAKAVLLPLYLFGERDPAALGNFSYIGRIPNSYFTSVANMADTSVHKIVNPNKNTEERFQIFPMTMRGGKHGYDGIAVRYDTNHYG